MRVIVAEKPSLARAIAACLPGPVQRRKHHIECGDGDVVAWCVGHILEPALPEAYGAHLKGWTLEALPIAPKDWKLAVTAPELLAAIERLLRGASRVVHAGDPDREGQLLVDEVLQFLGYRGPVDRLLVRDLRPEAVRLALAKLEPNAKYRPLSESALARQRADWLFGMNMTRLYTLLGQASGYGGVLSVGRVQTPVLGLVVARDRAIADFRPSAYYLLRAELGTDQGETFRAAWQPGPDAEAFLDPDKRLLRRAPADAARERLEGRSGSVRAVTHEKRSEAPPLPYSLAHLQIDAGRRLGLSAKEVLGAAQSLYETHRLTTYPRSDCSYLPEGQRSQATEVFAAIRRHLPHLEVSLEQANPSLVSRAWSDRKVTAHHAIIPTPYAKGPTPALSAAERAVFELIAARYVAQFLPAHEYQQTRVELEVGGEQLLAFGRQTVTLGWKALAPDTPPVERAAPSSDDAQVERLPVLAVGVRITVRGAAVLDKQTQPPKRFTDSTLMAAMCGVANFVKDPQVKKLLTESDGIGTPATRTAIIETLLSRGFVERSGKSLVSTPTGRALIRALPAVATTPDLTAAWESAMRAIASEERSLAEFLDTVQGQLVALVEQGRSLQRIVVPAIRTANPRRPGSARPTRGARAQRKSARERDRQPKAT